MVADESLLVLLKHILCMGHYWIYHCITASLCLTLISYNPGLALMIMNLEHPDRRILVSSLTICITLPHGNQFSERNIYLIWGLRTSCNDTWFVARNIDGICYITLAWSTEIEVQPQFWLADKKCSPSLHQHQVSNHNNIWYYVCVRSLACHSAPLEMAFSIICRYLYSPQHISIQKYIIKRSNTTL